MLIKKKAIISIILLSILLIPLISAIGISPAYFEIPYQPGGEVEYEYYIKVGERESNTVRIYAKGDLNDTIGIGEEIKTLVPGTWTPFKFKIKFPRQVQAPGLHENRLGLVEQSEVERSGVSVLSGAESRLFIRVPFEGRFLELKSFEIPNGEVNKPVNFYVTGISRGKEDINSAIFHLDILNPQNQVIDKIKSDNKPIKLNEEVTLTAQWQTDAPGAYSANGFVIYDDNFLELSQQGFLVGDLILKITNALAPQVKKGEITKIYFDVDSMWNAQIENVYADLAISNKQGAKVGEERSQTFAMPPWSKKPATIYWDSRLQEPGEYEGKITLHYSGKTDEAKVTITIKNPSVFSILKQNIALTAGASILVLLLILNILYMLKRKRKKAKT